MLYFAECEKKSSSWLSLSRERVIFYRFIQTFHRSSRPRAKYLLAWTSDATIVRSPWHDVSIIILGQLTRTVDQFDGLISPPWYSPPSPSSFPPPPLLSLDLTRYRNEGTRGNRICISSEQKRNTAGETDENKRHVNKRGLKVKRERDERGTEEKQEGARDKVVVVVGCNDWVLSPCWHSYIHFPLCYFARVVEECSATWLAKTVCNGNLIHSFRRWRDLRKPGGSSSYYSIVKKRKRQVEGRRSRGERRFKKHGDERRRE